MIAEQPSAAASAPAHGASASSASRTDHTPILLTLAASALSAVALTLAAPPASLGWLGWLALAPWFWAILRASTARQAAVFGFVHGFVYLLTLVPWFAAFTPAGYPVAAGYWGILAAGIGYGAWVVFRQAPSGWAPPLLASGWVILEWLRAQGVLAFPWGSLAGTQSKALPVLQMLDLTGSYGLSFLMALFAAAVACLAVPRFRTSGMRWSLGAAVVTAVFVGRGIFLLSQPADDTTIKVAVVQSSESRKTVGAAVECVSPFEEYEVRTRDALRERPDLVVWPETACTADVVNTPGIRSQLLDLLGPAGAHFLTGSFVTDLPSGQVTNSAALLSPKARVLGQYAKMQIVPFGEYLPARPLLGWTVPLGMPERDLKAGTSLEPLRWSKGAIGVSICFESAFGNVSRRMVAKGANVLAILTSDGWNGRASAGLQHATFAPLRAVEERRSVIRAAATGVSQVIDPYGRPLRSLPMFTKGYLVADAPLRIDRTLYSHLGDWPVLVAWLVLLSPLALFLRRASLHRP